MNVAAFIADFREVSRIILLATLMAAINIYHKLL